MSQEIDGYEDGFEASMVETSVEKKYPEVCPNPECGAPNPDNASVCGSCEKKFEPVEPEDTENYGDED